MDDYKNAFEKLNPLNIKSESIVIISNMYLTIYNGQATMLE